MIEGYMAKYKGIIWMIRGCFTYNNRIVALPRYILTKNNVLTIKDPVKALAVAEAIAPENIVFVPCIGRKAPLLDPQEIVVLDPINYKPNPNNPIHMTAYKLIDRLRAATGIKEIGVTGGLLVGKQTGDIDIVVYGRRGCFEIYKYLEKNRVLKPYTREQAITLLQKRGQKIFNDRLIEKESKKVLQGFYQDTEVYIRLIPCNPRKPRECTEIVEKKGEIKALVTIEDATLGFLYPCTYIARIKDSNKVIDDEIVRITSDRGRFCELFERGEEAFVKGELEKVYTRDHTYYQIYLCRNEHYLLPK